MKFMGTILFSAREGNGTFLLGSAVYANFHFFFTLSFFFLFYYNPFFFIFFSKIKYMKVKKEILCIYLLISPALSFSLSKSIFKKSPKKKIRKTKIFKI